MTTTNFAALNYALKRAAVARLGQIEARFNGASHGMDESHYTFAVQLATRIRDAVRNDIHRVRIDDPAALQYVENNGDVDVDGDVLSAAVTLPREMHARFRRAVEVLTLDDQTIDLDVAPGLLHDMRARIDDAFTASVLAVGRAQARQQ